MDLITVSQISKQFGISTRMLRYYEQRGILQSRKIDGYAYRMYDETAVRHLQQIIVLRKLRISIKHIEKILTNQDTITAIEVFRQSVNELNIEITALSTMRKILNEFIFIMQKNTSINLDSAMFSDKSILNIMNTLSLTKHFFKEVRVMDELDKANQNISMLNNVRIIYIPTYTVTSINFIGENPENGAGEQLTKFLSESKLFKLKPDARVFGFNNPNPDFSQDTPCYGYELLVTIPDDFDVPAPLIKKHFEGGIYAVHMIKMGDFYEMDLLVKWVENSDEYATNYSKRGNDTMVGYLEEHLNYVFEHQNNEQPWFDKAQIDLMIPVKEKK